jgi:hypothetical protein
MLDQTRTDTTGAVAALDGQSFDLVVVGAGIAGLNALNSASEYLPKGARVLLLDQKEKPGGMWTVAYDYVRLHQPHPMFTVGDQKWDWTRPQHYLAARDEVQAHLARCLDRSGAGMALTTGFGTTVTSCVERNTPEGPRARVVFHPNDASDVRATVSARQVIEAEGLNVGTPVPLELSSPAVLSITPDMLRATLAAHPDAPVYVIGGGKTGMDTIIETLNGDATRQVSALVGKGTDFFNRNRNLPTGATRWFKGKPTSRVFHDIATRFNGDNEDATAAHFRATYATEPGSSNQQFLYGLLSEEELARIETGLAWRKFDYLADVVDTGQGPAMTLKSGETIPIREGSIVVNCTGAFFRDNEPPVARPCLSTHGTILSVNMRDALHFLTSVSGFFLPHLHYRGLLKDHGFYTIDMDALFRKDRTTWVAATSTQAYLTQALAVQNLPLSLLDRCGLDFDRWYPFPRRMAALIQMKTGASRDIPHCHKVLDRVAERFGVQCGPLTPGDRNG